MASTIHGEIDYDKDGRQVGWLYLPHSPHSDAWGAIPIPIAVLQGRSGPDRAAHRRQPRRRVREAITLGRRIRELDPGAFQAG